MQIQRATREHLEALTPLFNAYRVFYKQKSDTTAAQTFLNERFEKQDSVIFLAKDEAGNAVGFTQLYPSFSSVAMKRVYILNDLFVTPEARGKQAGTALLEQAKSFAKEHSARGLVLETDADNPAQKLYEKNGWTHDPALHYYWEV
ncbi:GNAT family N-acetyltransferase [Gilvibacter sediminis]|uniref:GNAT family N-acetyltransferase n=1 Tax=Gilvibacter sediminis TaxID=379071 RepID=UPI002350F516|nr:GNAT family N-acetyltransferase [Gilvibacter sediminis]MDC7997821.1 GNAT family N-acetyltransferase [Gilvibacter sediminis]